MGTSSCRRSRPGFIISVLAGSLLIPAARGDDYSVLYAFSGQSGFPHAPMVKGSDGKIYGTTQSGGVDGLGSIYVLTPNGGGYDYADLFALSDESDGDAFRGPIVEGADGLFYGTTFVGGSSGAGTIFRISKAGAFELLFTFDGATTGAQPTGLILGSDGSFYGTTTTGGPNQFGTVFKFDPPSTLTTLYGFGKADGATPSGTVFEAADGYLYGLNAGGGAAFNGTVYRVSLDGTLTTLHAFSYLDGSSPVGELVAGADGNLYGATQVGGSQGNGVIFRVTLAGVVTDVYDFGSSADVGERPGAGLVQASDGNLYGATTLGGSNFVGSVYRLDGGGVVTSVAALSSAAGTGPFAPLAEVVTGHLLGAALTGGAARVGALFDCDLAGSLSAVHSFVASLEGAQPAAAVVEGAPGVFYGTTEFNGANGLGTVFRIDGPGAATPLHTFGGDDGAHPVSSLTFGQDGRLYGTALFDGGPPVQGSVFALDTSGSFQLIHVFDTPGVGLPWAGLLSASDGNLYGLAYSGGAFRVTTAGDFALIGGVNGSLGTLIESKGLFYGTTASGGASNAGTIFSMDPSGAAATLAEFSGPPGGLSPEAGLVKGNDGAFYGTTGNGGAYGFGTIFRMDGAGGVRTIYSFGSDASHPQASLIQASDGFLYGTSSAGGYQNDGAVFRVSFAGTGFSVVHAFTGPDGLVPTGSVIQASDGALVGTAEGGGDRHGGVVFRLGLPPSTLAVTGTLPSSGPSSGGGAVAIAGSAFVAGATASIGGADAPVTALIDPTNLVVTAPALAPGTLYDVAVTLPDASSASLPAAFLADFTDVPGADIFHDTVETIFRDGITAGCGAGAYCRNNPVTRAQMAVFLLKAKNGSAYTPPTCSGIFSDVACPSLYADWIEDLAVREITAGCGVGIYCPSDPVTRQQMAVFLLKTAYSPAFVPASCTGLFGDVTCPGQFSDWIEQLYALRVTGGCSASPLLYCPTNAVSRGQMSAFLVRMFNLN